VPTFHASQRATVWNENLSVELIPRTAVRAGDNHATRLILRPKTL
jgi:hypothetical protein